MPRQSNQKMKILYLMKILLEKTDEQHPMTLQEIMDELSLYGVTTERKSLYDDFETLRVFGLDIVGSKGKRYAYYVASRTFELPELKLLVDAVQSSRFITRKKSNELIKKVESLLSVHEANRLQRQVYVANRIKTMNESIYYNVDTLHEAIAMGKKITFLYDEWVVDFQSPKKVKRKYRHDGARYSVSPWALAWDDENYYLVAFDDNGQCIKHFRVDKMSAIQTTDEQRVGQEAFDRFDLGVYSKKVFGMFGGEEETVSLRFENRFIGVVIDRFGEEAAIRPDGEEHFFLTTKVAVSPQFMAWLFGLGTAVKVIAPESLAQAYQKELEKVLEAYK